jgi:hypothetical protein
MRKFEFAYSGFLWILLGNFIETCSWSILKTTFLKRKKARPLHLGIYLYRKILKSYTALVSWSLLYLSLNKVKAKKVQIAYWTKKYFLSGAQQLMLPYLKRQMYLLWKINKQCAAAQSYKLFIIF